jgi:hypothetical protein
MYQLWATKVTGVAMRDISSVHFPLYPLSSNLNRMMRFSGSSNHSLMSAYEASDLLYQISLEDLSQLRSQAQAAEVSIKETSKKPLPMRLVSFISDAEYRHMNYSRKLLQEKERFVKVSSDYLKTVTKQASIESLPVGLASNTLFAAARLGLALSDLMTEKLLPLLDKKLSHLHALGLAETLWALASHKQTGELFGKVLKELQSRQVKKTLDVVTSPFNHLEYIRDPEPEVNRHAQLLNDAAELVADEGLKNSLREQAARFKD